MNPRRIKANLSVDLREFYRNKATMFFVLLFPILLMLLFGFIFQDMGETVYDLHVQDLDGGPQSTNFTALLNDTGLFNVIMLDSDVDPTEYIEENGANTILVIPSNYSGEVEQILVSRFMGMPVNDSVNLTVVYDPTDSLALTKVQILASLVDGINKGYSGVPDVIGVDVETSTSESFEFIDFFTPGIIAMSVMSTSLFGTVGINTELRQKGVLRKLATTPLTRSEWLVSNILYQLCMATLSTIAILGIGFVVFDLSMTINLFLPLFVLLNVFSFSGIGMMITRFVKEAQSAEAAANAVMFPMMFLAGTFFQLEMMPGFLQAIARVLPLYYVNEGLRDSLVYENYAGAMLNAAVIGVFGIVVFVLGVLLTSWKEE